MDDFDKIVTYYKRCNSMKQTAKKFDLSVGKIRKILITTGNYYSSRASVIAERFENGETPKQIAEILSVSLQTVNNYLPYTKGHYNGNNPTINAIRIRKYRKKTQ